MKVCSKCGTVTKNDSDEFCIKCGAYFAETPQQKSSNPMMAAMGVVNAPARPTKVPIPEGGTFDSGMQDLAAGNFSEAMAQWTSWVRTSEPTSDQYGMMVDASSKCLIDMLGFDRAHLQTGVPDLAMELEEDFIQDLLAKVMDGTVIDSREKAADLAKVCLKFALDSFDVYPDLRDVLDAMKDVPSYMDTISTQIQGFPDDGGRAQTIIDVHGSFANMMCDVMAKAIEDAGEQRMDLLAEYWSNKANLPYVNIVNQIYTLFCQINSIQGAGKFAKKLFQKGLDLQVDGFRKSYFSPKV